MGDTSDLIYLFQNQTIDANSTAVSVPYPNKKARFYVWGTFASAIIKVQTNVPNTSTWIDVPDWDGNSLTFTVNSQRTLEDIVLNEKVRAVQSGSTGSTSLNVLLQII